MTSLYIPCTKTHVHADSNADSNADAGGIVIYLHIPANRRAEKVTQYEE